jgi:hypothetical protein
MWGQIRRPRHPARPRYTGYQVWDAGHVTRMRDDADLLVTVETYSAEMQVNDPRETLLERCGCDDLGAEVVD